MRPLMIRLLLAVATGVLAPAPRPAPGLAAQSPVGVFDGQTDVGRVRQAGSAQFDPRYQEYRISGSGQNMWDNRDDFHFVWKRMTGNFILSAYVNFIGPNVEEHRKIGWTIRPSLATN